MEALMFIPGIEMFVPNVDIERGLQTLGMMIVVLIISLPLIFIGLVIPVMILCAIFGDGTSGQSRQHYDRGPDETDYAYLAYLAEQERQQRITPRRWHRRWDEH